MPQNLWVSHTCYGNCASTFLFKSKSIHWNWSIGSLIAHWRTKGLGSHFLYKAPSCQGFKPDCPCMAVHSISYVVWNNFCAFYIKLLQTATRAAILLEKLSHINLSGTKRPGSNFFYKPPGLQCFMYTNGPDNNYYCNLGPLYTRNFKNSYKAQSSQIFRVYKAPFASFSRLVQPRHPELICVILIGDF